MRVKVTRSERMPAGGGPRDAGRHAHRRRRLPRAQRGDPGRRAQGRAHCGDELVGFLDGWDGVIERPDDALDVASLRGMLPRGGTMLGTSRTNPFKIDGGVERCRATLRRHGIDALVAIGGEDTLGVAAKLYDDSACPSSACRRRSTTTSSAPR